MYSLDNLGQAQIILSPRKRGKTHKFFLLDRRKFYARLVLPFITKESRDGSYPPCCREVGPKRIGPN